ncbi:MAG: bifunctional (p)ppGpp synthetase/guanosine-3',5'-bis(diphosphate) 3'-pyrophosphohydrolase [Hyphomicrobiaceae bacterium]|nr:bifunctional (p)ppGpp synthetase/guanosine-3',5'-bis(diphosphate) 3'-pyrophosphohydrolase [Hyphomicrobiaceae bacterium]
MTRQFELVEKVLAYNPKADENLLNRAYVYAMQKHGSQTRASGAPYIQHPLEVASILTDLKMDDATIAVALLHDTIEDTDATRAEIDQLFGAEIGAIVEGLTKIQRLKLVSREEAQAENLRKLLLAISQDVRVLMVKLADRLHNMRTINFVPEEKRKRIAQETMDIYAPLAGRMGMQDMRSELEDICFSVLHPDHYKAITERLRHMEADSKGLIAQIRTELTHKLAESGVAGVVSARLKTPWSIFRKIETKSIAFEQLSDIVGFRIIVETIDDCYRALGVVHATWKMVPGRFKDYISVPKYNEYRSIHTTIVGPGRHRAELQIRTEAMHEVAEYGIAAHALYKEGLKPGAEGFEHDSQAYAWLRHAIEHLTEGDDTKEFLEYTKLELFQDQVFCFTPRGRLIALPRGATPVDFAYAVHTDIGDTCIGAKINGVYAPVITQLRNGDEVEILRDYNHHPPASWESIAATGKARAAIRRNIRTREEQRVNRLGEEVLRTLFQQSGIEDEDDALGHLIVELGLRDAAALYVAVGKGQVTAKDLNSLVDKLGGRRSLFRRRKKVPLPAPMQPDGWLSLRQSELFKFRVPGGQNVKPAMRKVLDNVGFNTPVAVSPEGVVPGDRMVGILDETGTITVYPVHSDALSELHDKDVGWIDVLWEPAKSIEQQLFRVTISVLAANRPGMLAQTSTTIASSEINIHNLVLRTVSTDFHQLIFQVEVRDVVQLDDLLTLLKQVQGLSKARRANYGEAKAIARIETAVLED